MATIQDINSANAYVGNAGIGTGSSGVITIDASPVMELARYTMFRNKADYDQRQKDIDAKILDLAEYTALDLNGTRAKDRDLLLTKDDELKKKADEFARYTPTSQRDKVEKELQFKREVQLLKNDIKSANARAIGYGVRLNAINAGNFDAKTKEDKVKKLNEEFDGTDIATPIRAEDVYTVEVPTLPKAPMMEFDVTELGANNAIVTTNTLFDGGKADALAFSFLQGFDIAPLPANATEREKTEYAQRQAAFNKGGAKLYTQGADLLNEALADPRYKNADGTVNYDAIKSSNKLLSSIIGQIDGWNNYAENITDKIDKNAFYDKTGIKPVTTMMDKDGYLTIDKAKPITAEQLIKVQLWSNAQSDKKQEKFIETNDQIENARLANDRAQLAEGRRQFNKTHPDIEIPEGGFGNLIYGVNVDDIRITNTPGAVAIVNGTIVDKDGNIIKSKTDDVKVQTDAFNNSIITEYNKYVGAKKTVTEADGTTKTTENAAAGEIDVTRGYIKTKFENGVITGIYAKDGTLIDTDLFEHVTRQAGQKGVTKYKSPDLGYGKFGNTGNGATIKDASYYQDESNLQSQNGNTFTYNDGSVMIYNSKTGTLTPKK